MKAFVLLFSDQHEAAAEALALSRNDWNAVVTGPNEGTQIRQDGNFVADLASSWVVFASQQNLHDPND